MTARSFEELLRSAGEGPGTIWRAISALHIYMRAGRDADGGAA